MSDKKYTYTLEAEYKGAGELGKLKADLKSISQIESMKGLGKDVLELNRKLKSSQDVLKQQATEMKAADKITRKMSESYKKQQKAVSKLATALEKKKRAYRQSREAVKAAGVDTAKLAGAEKRLAAAASATGKVWAARRAIGVRSHRDVTAEINRLKSAYDNLRKSGTLTSKELFQAKQKLNTKIRDLRASTSAWATDLSRVHTGLLGLAGVGYGVGKAFAEFSGFETGMAEVYTLVDTSKEKFAEFKDEVRDVAEDLPQRTNDLTKALYDIVSAGVDLGDSTAVLELSAKAATAGITDTQTAANVGIGAMNAYGKGVDDLGSIYDILFETVKSGVTTFPALAQSIGDVLPTARAADVDLKEVGAAVASLTKAGIKTPQAMTALKGAIKAMAAPTPEAKRRFEELGITWEGLVPTLEQIRSKGLTIDQMRMLIPDSEAMTGVISLTQNFDEFKAILGSMDNATGSMEDAYEKMADTPDHEIKLMTKALAEMANNLGQLASAVILPTAKAISFLVSMLNEAPKPVRILTALIGGAVTGSALWYLGIGQVVKGLWGMLTATKAAVIGIRTMTALKVVPFLTSFNTASLIAAAGSLTLAAALKAVAVASVALWSGMKVYEAIKAYREMRDAQEMAAQSARNAEAAEGKYQTRLKRASEAAGVTLKSWREVQQAYKDGLLDYDRVTDTYSKGSGKRREAYQDTAAAARESADEQKKVTGEALKEMEQQYQEYAAEIKRIQEEIVGRQRTLAEDLRSMSRTGMDDVSAWKDLKKEASEYENAAKKAAAAGDFNTAVEMADKARDKYKELNQEVKLNDQVVISSQEALKVAMDGVKRSGELAIGALEQQQKAAGAAMDELTEKSGFQDLSKSMDDSKRQWLKNWQEMKGKTIAELEEVSRKIDQVIKDRQMTVYVKEAYQKAAGGPVGRVQALAAGGGVGFRNMLGGGFFPGFGGGDRRHVVAEDGEYMFDKHRVRHAGIGVVRAFHAGRYDLVVAELTRKFKLNLADIIHRRMGGMIAAVNSLPVPGPQMLAAGGAVVGSGSGETDIREIVVRIPGSNLEARVSGSDRNAEALEQIFRAAYEGSS